MSKDNDKKGIKKGKRSWLKGAVAAVAFGTAAMGMSGCTDGHNDPQNQGIEQTETVPTEVAQLDSAAEQGQLVEGRESCIEKLTEAGLTASEANDTCDEIQQQAIDIAAADQPTNTTTTVYRDSSASNALLWYWIGTMNSRPVVYGYQPTSTGSLNRVTPVSSAATRSAPPASLTSTQRTYLAAPPAQRAAVARTLASRPGVETTTRTVKPKSTTTRRTTTSNRNTGARSTGSRSGD